MLHEELYRVAMRLTLDSSQACDLVQDSMMRLWNVRSRLDGVENLRGYALMTLRHCLADSYRTRGRSAGSMDLDSLQDTPDDDGGDMKAIEARSDLELVRRLFDSLGSRQRLVMELSSFDGLSTEEIASTTGLSEANVRAILSRTRRKLRELMTLNSR